MTRPDPLTTATLAAFDFECRLQGIDPDAERAKLLAEAHAKAQHSTALIPLILAATLLVLIGAGAAVIVIAMLLGPL